MEIQHPIYKELENIQSFFDKNEIKYLDKNAQKNGYTIDFTLNLKSYISETEIAEVFQFVLFLKKQKNDLLEFEIYIKQSNNIPFHPNFKLLNYGLPILFFDKKAIWVGSLEKHYNVVEYVKEMILSLQYHKKYININEVGNEKAKDWYLKKLHLENTGFPTDTKFDKFISTKKTFNPIAKKFTIDSDKKSIVNLEPTKNKKFTIVDKTDYTLKEKTVPKNYFEADEALNSTCENLKSNALLYISKKAKNQIWEHISWGDLNTSANKNEQGGILLGQVYIDKERENQVGIVEEVVFGKSAKGNPTYLEMNHSTWSEMLEAADSIIDAQPEADIQIIGWYHTHPNGLDVFMSGTDLNTQSRFFNKDWHYAIVLNPHREIWKAFVGKNADECKGFFIQNEKTANNLNINSANTENLKKKDKLIWVLIVLIVILITIILFDIYRKMSKPFFWY